MTQALLNKKRELSDLDREIREIALRLPPIVTNFEKLNDEFKQAYKAKCELKKQRESISDDASELREIELKLRVHRAEMDRTKSEGATLVDEIAALKTSFENATRRRKQLKAEYKEMADAL